MNKYNNVNTFFNNILSNLRYLLRKNIFLGAYLYEVCRPVAEPSYFVKDIDNYSDKLHLVLNSTTSHVITELQVVL